MDDTQWAAIRPALIRLRASIAAAAFGSVSGLGLWVCTVWLLLQGGEDVGKHLSLLGHYYPGYDVSWTGAFVGLFYGALTGAVLGYLVSWVYNVTALRKVGRSVRAARASEGGATTAASRVRRQARQSQ